MTGIVQPEFRSPVPVPFGLRREAMLMATFASLPAHRNTTTRRTTSGSTPYIHLSFSAAALTGLGDAVLCHLIGEETGDHHP